MLWFFHWQLAGVGLRVYRPAEPDTMIGDTVAGFLTGMTPPAVLSSILPSAPGLSPGKSSVRGRTLIAHALVGLLYRAVLTRLLWLAAKSAFEEVCNRRDVQVPDGLRPKGKRRSPVPWVP